MLANEFHGCRMEQVPYPKTSIRGIIANDTKQPQTPIRVPSVRMRGFNGVALERRFNVLVSSAIDILLTGAEGVLIYHPLLLR